MTSTRPDPRPLIGDLQARLRALLVVLGVLVAVIGLGAPAASAGAATGAGNGVAAINPESGTPVAATPGVSPGRVGVSDLLFDDGAVVSLVAPRPTAGSIRNVNPLGGTQNCVNCVIATDARLAGRPASALNSAGAQPISILEQHFGGAFKQVAGRSEIERILSSSGPGSRGIVFGSRGADPGHVFNAVNQNGVIRFLDGQSGSVASFDGFSGFYFLPTS